MTTHGFYRTVMAETGVTDLAAVKKGTAAVMHALRDRLTPEEARQAAAQLPRELKNVWFYGEARGRRPIKMHRKDFYERVRGEAGFTTLHEARTATAGVFAALKITLSSGEGADIEAQLPADLKALWMAA
jgi:uncharacterized protein (DUF2267 family)